MLTQDIIQCTKCVLDTKDDPKIIFDSNGVCNHCLKYEKTYVHNALTENQKLDQFNLAINSIKSEKGKYNCIMGLSGGVDSSYMAYLAKDWGLKVLLVHYDNGWNSELAVDNINRIVDYTGFDLETYVEDWDEFKALQLSYIKASVMDWEVPTDHGFVVALFEIAKKHKIKNILTGHNYQTESILPHSMRYDKTDTENIKSIYKEMTGKSLKKFKLYSPLKLYFLNKIYGFIKHPLFEYLEYNKDEAKQIIKDKMGWRDYGGKHYESIFTRFYQGYVLPTKFGIDKRKAHMASLINSGQLTKQQALVELKNPPYPNDAMLTEDYEYVAKKFDMTVEAFNQLLAKPPVPHESYKQYQYKLLKKLKKLEVYVNPNLYINYLKRRFFAKK